jgi:hypothetical protein
MSKWSLKPSLVKYKLRKSGTAKNLKKAQKIKLLRKESSNTSTTGSLPEKKNKITINSRFLLHPTNNKIVLGD